MQQERGSNNYPSNDGALPASAPAGGRMQYAAPAGGLMQGQGAAAYVIPRSVAALTGRLPRLPGSVLFVLGLNLLLRQHLPADVLERLENRSLCIAIADAGVRFDYTCAGGVFRASRAPAAAPDLCIKANAWDFHCLLRRTEDPDTLFFSRRLVIEGDTELGLMVKNTLDGVDMTALAPKAVLQSLLGRLAALPKARAGALGSSEQA